MMRYIGWGIGVILWQIDNRVEYCNTELETFFILVRFRL